TLLSYGLDGTAHTPVRQLSKDQERRLRLIAALHDATKRALVLNDPFDEITSQWRERFAELLLSHTRAHHRLVIIPGLTYRPECWIDNPLIARTEVGEEQHRTIGFGGQPSQMSELAHQMRSLFASEEEARKALENVERQRAPQRSRNIATASTTEEPS